MAVFDQKLLFVVSVLLYVIGFPLVGAFVGYRFYIFAAALGRPVTEEDLSLFIAVGVAFAGFAGLLGLRELLRLAAAKRRAAEKESS